MKKTIRSLQKGRSMVEVIAILAVMGVLLIAGMVGFKILLDYFKQKETIEQVTTIGMRYKASRLNIKANPKTGYVKTKEFYPEGNNCGENGSNPDCILTPDGTEVRLFSIADTKNFVVITNFNNARTCEEVALMGGYEYAFGLNTVPTGNNSEFLEKANRGRDQDMSSNTVLDGDGNSFSFSADYLKSNPTALKTFCDTNMPSAFVYTAGNCEYMCGGVCQSCPCGLVADRNGNCCDDDALDCGLCGGCTNGVCKTDNGTPYCTECTDDTHCEDREDGRTECDEEKQRCVECVEDNDCAAKADTPYCVNKRCVACNNAGDGCGDADKCCNFNNECIDFDTNFWVKNTTTNSCTCKRLNWNDICEADCNCTHLPNAGCFAMPDGKKRCVTLPDAEGCSADADCTSGNCCGETPDTKGWCCPSDQGCCGDSCCENTCCNNECCAEGQICKPEGCTQPTPADCPAGTVFCNGFCYPEEEGRTQSCGPDTDYDTACCKSGDQCLTAENGAKYCGQNPDSCTDQGLEWCEDENDCCQLGEMCVVGIGCVQCPEETTLTCGNSTKQDFASQCYKTKHLNCLDRSGVKDVPTLIELAPTIKTPICDDDTDGTNAECKACDSTAECQALQSNGDKNRTSLSENEETEVDGILFKDFVCRRGHSGADEKYNGSCGPCIDDTDCEGDDVPCLKSGKCGCQENSDCAFNCNGKTKCAIPNCVCDDGLTEDSSTGKCTCQTPTDTIWSFKEGSPKYGCCQDDYMPVQTNGSIECYPICNGADETINRVVIFLDYSYSTRLRNIENDMKAKAQIIIDAVREAAANVGRDIEINVYREDTGIGSGQSGQNCLGAKTNISVPLNDLDQDLCSYNCGGNKGVTCFNEAKRKIDNTSNTLFFILSDGIIPSDTVSGIPEDKRYVFAEDDTNIPDAISFSAISRSIGSELHDAITTNICVDRDDSKFETMCVNNS